MRTSISPCAELNLSRDSVTWRSLGVGENECNYLDDERSNESDSIIDERYGLMARLRDARLARGLTLEEFARKLGVARSEALDWETCAPCPEFWLRKASALLQVDYDWLTTGRRAWREERVAAPTVDSLAEAPTSAEEERRALCELLRKMIAVIER